MKETGATQIVNAQLESHARRWLRLALLMSALAAYFFLGASRTLAAGCVLMVETPYYIDFGGSNYKSAPVTFYSDSACEESVFTASPASNRFAYSSSHSSALSICRSHAGSFITAVNNPWVDKNVWNCSTHSLPDKYGPGDRYIGGVSAHDASEAMARCNHYYADYTTNYVRRDKSSIYTTKWECYYIKGRRSGGSGGVERNYCVADVILPLDGLRLHAVDGMNSGIEFRRTNPCGVGNQEALDMGYLDAVDVWSNIGSGYSVCFPQIGRIVFLDAATSPRALVYPEYHYEDGHSCVTMTTAGTLVLVEPAAGTEEETATTTRRPGTDDSVKDAIELENCRVRPRFNLRLRSAPWGKILDVMPLDSEAPAKARTESWFNVSFEAREGWSAAWLTDADGDCDWPSPGPQES